MSTISANMALQIPDSGDSDYPTSISTSLNNIDDHDHTSGNGVQVPTGGIADLAVTSAKLAAAAVTSGKVASSSADGSTIEVSGGAYRIKDAGVTKAKLAALGQQTGTVGAGGFSTTSASSVDVTGLSATLTTTGRPVMLVISNGTAAVGAVQSSGGSLPIELYRDSTLIVGATFLSGTSLGLPVFAVHIDAPAAGTYVYKVKTNAPAGIGTTTIGEGVKLIAYEL